MFQVSISVLSILSAAIPIPVVSAAAAQVLDETKSALSQATTMKTVIDQAHVGPGEKKSSNELDMGPAERKEFLVALLTEQDGQYLWVNKEELKQLKTHIKCEPERYVFTKIYCEWKLLFGMKDPEGIDDNVTEKAAITSIGTTWGSNVKKLNVTSIETLRNCTLQVWVKQTRRLTGCFRVDKEIAQGRKQLDVRVDEDCNQTIDVPIDVGKARTVNCQITIKFE
ncbi:Conserved oligomeric Golgi complex subunit [Phytophthora palmivora]|uniref:Conserved oligomeric Golgi complex subunit n=1 Tax=Phytophthora palmivora TaxID=4796 RepID=A0A2P4WVM7_9STRA|nr:Conserved oligomeric Golgi complex subunit [Phytophthora palmivora]